MSDLRAALTIRRAAKQDLSPVEKLLSATNLPVEGISDHLQNFLVAEMNREIIGTIGLEVYENTGLLRSAAVIPNLQNKGIGSRLLTMMLDFAKEQGVQELFLLTTTARNYFSQKGFVPIKREQVRGNILSSSEFQGACPSTAICMRKTL
jgi:amino-acid N-acetyltransferase